MIISISIVLTSKQFLLFYLKYPLLAFGKVNCNFLLNLWVDNQKKAIQYGFMMAFEIQIATSYMHIPYPPSTINYAEASEYLISVRWENFHFWQKNGFFCMIIQSEWSYNFKLTWVVGNFKQTWMVGVKRNVLC